MENNHYPIIKTPFRYKQVWENLDSFELNLFHPTPTNNEEDLWKEFIENLGPPMCWNVTTDYVSYKLLVRYENRHNLNEKERSQLEKELSDRGIEVGLWKPAYENYIKEKTLLNQRISELQEFCQEINRPYRCSNQQVKSKELTETYFYGLLKNSIGDDIHNNVEFRINESKGNVYIPDILYWNEEKGIFIDIEVDEPYSTNSFEPIHYEKADDERDVYLLNEGYFIVRFAEEQIIKYPVQSTRFVCSLIKKIIDIKKYPLSENIVAEINVALGDDNVPVINQWTKAQAQKMSVQDYRNSYLHLKDESIEAPNCFI